MVPASADPSAYTRSWYIQGRYPYSEPGAVIWYPENLPDCYLLRFLPLSWANLLSQAPIYWTTQTPGATPVFGSAYTIQVNDSTHSQSFEWNYEPWEDTNADNTAFTKARPFAGHIEARVNSVSQTQTAISGTINTGRIETLVLGVNDKLTAAKLKQAACPNRDYVVSQPIADGVITLMGTDVGKTYNEIPFARSAGGHVAYEDSYGMAVQVPFIDGAGTTSNAASCIMVSPYINASIGPANVSPLSGHPGSVAQYNIIKAQPWPVCAAEIELHIYYTFYYPVDGTTPPPMQEQPVVTFGASLMFAIDKGAGINYTATNVQRSFRFNNSDKDIPVPPNGVYNTSVGLHCVETVRFPVHCPQHGSFIGYTVMAGVSAAADATQARMQILKITNRFLGIHGAAHVISWDQRPTPAESIVINGRIDSEIKLPMTLQPYANPSNIPRSNDLNDMVAATDAFLIQGRVKTSNNLLTYNQDIANKISPLQ